MSAYRFLALLAILLVGVGAQLRAVFAPERAKAAATLAKQTLSAPPTLKSAFFASRLAESLDSGDVKCSCAKLTSLLSKETEPLEIYYGISAAEACRCSDVKLNDAHKQVITAGLMSSELPTLAGALLASKSAGISTDGGREQQQSLQKLLDLQSPDGSFKIRSAAPGRGNLINAKLALAALFAHKDSGVAKLGDALDKALQLLPSGDEEGDGVAVDATLVVYLSAQIDKRVKDGKIKPRQLLALASSLMPLQHAGLEDDLQSLAMCVESLHVLEKHDTSAPLYRVQAAPGASTLPLSGSGSATLPLSVTNIFGKKVVPSAGEVKSIKRLSGDKPTALDTRSATLAISASSGPVVDLSALQASDSLRSGRHAVEVSITLPEVGKPITTSIRFVVPRAISVANVLAGVSNSKKVSLSELITVGAQNKWNGGSASAEAADFLHVAFTLQQAPSGSNGKDKDSTFVKPHQCFVKLTHVPSGTDAFFVAGADSSASSDAKGPSQRYRAAVSMSQEVETLNHLSGEYTVTVLAADAATASPVEWVLGSLTVAVPPKVDKIAPLYTTSLLHASDNTLTALPEFEHLMRPPAKRASNFTATLFTVLSLAPLAAYVIFVLALAPNLSRLESIWSWLFLGCIGGALALFLAYWAGMPGAEFYSTIKYICFIVPATAVVARSAISAAK